MAKILVAKHSEKCNGCELCLIELQQQLEKLGLEDSLIRIFVTKETGKEYPAYTPEIDPRVNSLDIESVKKICPKLVFEIEELEN